MERRLRQLEEPTRPYHESTSCFGQNLNPQAKLQEMYRNNSRWIANTSVWSQSNIFIVLLSLRQITWTYWINEVFYISHWKTSDSADVSLKKQILNESKMNETKLWPNYSESWNVYYSMHFFDLCYAYDKLKATGNHDLKSIVLRIRYLWQFTTKKTGSFASEPATQCRL